MVEKRSVLKRVIGLGIDDGLYEANVRPETVITCNIANEINSDLCHYRMWHPSNKLIELTVKISRGTNLLNASRHIKECKPCKMGKSTRQPRYSGACKWHTHKASRPLERLYADVVEPIKYASQSHSEYLVTLLDDYSGYTLIQFLISKNEAAEAVKTMISEFESLFETSGNTIIWINWKMVRWLSSDGGGEYVNINIQKLS